MRIAITGASGSIGRALQPALREDGHEVVRLVRRPTRAPDEVRWDPQGGSVDLPRLDGVQAVIHLAGAGIASRPWTKAYRREIRDSRVLGTSTLANALATLENPPRVLLSGSAIGWYGDTGDRTVDESAPQAPGFLGDMVRDWEGATAPAEEAGIRVVHLRAAVVVTRKGGAFGPLFLAFKLGLGARLGSGRQYWSFVSIHDHVRATRFLLTADEISGPVNISSPEPATNAEITAAMGRVLRRPTILVIPAFVLRVALGEMSGELLGSRRVLPQRLLDADFAFRHPDIESAIRSVL